MCCASIYLPGCDPSYCPLIHAPRHQEHRDIHSTDHDGTSPRFRRPVHPAHHPIHHPIHHPVALLLQHPARRTLFRRDALDQPGVRVPGLHALRPRPPTAGLPSRPSVVHVRRRRRGASAATANRRLAPPLARSSPATAPRLKCLVQQLQQLGLQFQLHASVDAVVLPLPPPVPGQHVPDWHQPLLLQPLR